MKPKGDNGIDLQAEEEALQGEASEGEAVPSQRTFAVCFHVGCQSHGMTLICNLISPILISCDRFSLEWCIISHGQCGITISTTLRS